MFNSQHVSGRELNLKRKVELSKRRPQNQKDMTRISTEESFRTIENPPITKSKLDLSESITIEKITKSPKLNSFLDMELPKRPQKTIHIDLSQSPHFTPTSVTKEAKKTIKNTTSTDSPIEQKLSTKRKYKTESIEGSLTSKTISKEALDRTSPLQLDIGLAKPNKNTIIKILQKGSILFNGRGREKREQSPQIFSIPFRSNTTSPMKQHSPLKSPEQKSIKEAKDLKVFKTEGRVSDKKSSSPVSKFKLTFTERVDPIKNDEIFQRYKVKQSRINRVIEHRYITEKKEVKKLYQKNGPSQQMKRLGKQRCSQIELLSLKDQEFDVLKDFKHALVQNKIHPQASIMWRRSSNPLASRRIMESLRKTNPNRLSQTFKQKIEQFAEGAIGEQWFKQRYEDKTERKLETETSIEKEEKMNQTSEMLVSEGEVTANQLTSSLQLSNTSRPKTMSNSKPRTTELRSILSSSSRSGRQVVHSKAIGTTAENFFKKYLDKKEQKIEEQNASKEVL